MIRVEKLGIRRPNWSVRGNFHMRVSLCKCPSVQDMRLAVDSDSEEEIIAEESGDAQPESGVYTPSVIRRKRVLVEKHKLIIIMVGLPGRGKTYLCNKIKSYLTWLGHPTRHFNVGMYRRQNKKDGKMQDAAFFDKNNSAGLEARQLALDMAINDMLAWLRLEQSQVAIFDATNTTREVTHHPIPPLSFSLSLSLCPTAEP